MATVSELEAEIHGIEEYLRHEKARKLLKYVTRSGSHRGEIRYFTKKQYENITGKKPRAAIVNKKGRIPWELALDEIATELGYKSDQALKNAIEKCREMELKKAKLKRELSIAKEKKKAGVKCSLPIKAESDCSRQRIHGDWCKSKTVQCNGAEITAVRQPALWKIHVLKAGSKPTLDNQAGEVRYAKDANKTVRQIAQGMENKGKRKKRKKAKGRR